MKYLNECPYKKKRKKACEDKTSKDTNISQRRWEMWPTLLTTYISVGNFRSHLGR